MEMLESMIETQMAESHLFLSFVDPDIPLPEAQALLGKVGGDFLECYEPIITEQRCLIYQYGVHPDGSLIDLRDIDHQLKKEWIAVVSLWVGRSKSQGDQAWTLEHAPTSYQGRSSYNTSFLDIDTVKKMQYTSAGIHTEHREVDDTETSTALQIIVHILQRQETICRAEQLLIAHRGFEKKFGELCMSVSRSGARVLSQEKEIQELRKLVKRIKFK